MSILVTNPPFSSMNYGVDVSNYSIQKILSSTFSECDLAATDE